MICRRCQVPAPEGATFRDVTICAVLDAVLCPDCLVELAASRPIEAQSTITSRARRHADLHVRALAGPAANVQACLTASDVLEGAENALRLVIRDWLAERPARGKEN